MVSRFAFIIALFSAPLCMGTESSVDSKKAEPEGVEAGHSYHGEAFNEGPRQAAELIPGMAKIDFPTSAKNEITQKFIEQGISQLHGFWYLEAERSFRQAAKEEPELAISYWGMALANTNNDQRARGLIDEAMKRRNENTTRREKLYIEALDRFVPKKKKKSKDDKDSQAAPSKEEREKEREERKKRAERYLADLERILHEFPDDVEAKAMLAVQLWIFEGYGVKMASRYAASALIGEVFEQNPMHPAHHYLIHLWDGHRPQNALESAARCGPSSPGIAHMWHMPGHIYSKLKRYGDAAWQQEASARVDHAHMIRARLIPDQIHNYAHNNEWLTRNLLHVGRVREALDQARNLVSLPRHPKYNTLKNRGSYRYGRQRLIQTLTEYGLWKELIEESGGHYLPPTPDAIEQEQWLGWLSVAHFMTGNQAEGAKTLRSLRRRMIALRSQQLDLADERASQKTGEKDAAEDANAGKSADQQEESSEKTGEEEKPSEEELKKHIEQLRTIIARAAAAGASQRKDKEAFQKHVKNAKLNSLIQAQWQADAGDLPGAIKLAQRAVNSGAGQVRPVAVLVDLLWRKGDKDAAKKKFETLRKLAGHADLDTPMLAKLAPVAQAAGMEGDWRITPQLAKDLGERPPLDQLGPFRWQPYTAETWGAKNAAGELVASEEFSGRPHILIFYLGFGCLHCVEQLHAFSPMSKQFQDAGIEIVAISTENIEELQFGLKNFEEKLDIPLLSDGQQHIFKSFRCWDDFESQPLHGTFLIDARGRVRWQDISHEPFTDAKFLLEESKRLLSLP
ncbi:MAG: peroxiredoxin family protein [Pirellulales bacterium]|nr:peroxiredoxin family protein [Pirellulales bacterium]